MRPSAAKRASLIFTSAVLLVGAAAPAALAKQSTAPPGNSAVDEYTETVPGPTGGHPTHGDVPGGGAGQSGGGAPLPRKVAQQLRHAGPDGVAAAALAEQNSPRGSQAVKGATRSGGGGGQSVISQAVDVLGGSGGGMGAMLPIVLAASLLLAVGVGVGRRTRRGS
jgi:hypothetical protein